MKYSIWDRFLLCYYVFRSKMISPNIRIIRFPIDLRGRKNVEFGKNFTTGRYCRLEVYNNKQCKNPCLKIGENVQINDFVHITVMKSITIGDNVLMASHIYISDCQHGSYDEDNQSSPQTPPIERPYKLASVIIEDNVWIGDQVCILPGVVLGRGCVIGANSVVTKSIPAETMAVGSPAKVVKKWNNATQKWIKI